MTQEKLKEYPTLIDPFLDFEATKHFLGRGSCNHSISETSLDSGTLIYLNQEREGQEVASTPSYSGRACEKGIVVCGYKTKARGILGFLSPKVRTIPDAKKQEVKSELLEKLENNKPAYINFW
jgi:hypothetical protein